MSAAEIPIESLTPSPPAPKRGRPPVFNDQKRNHVCALLRLGCTMSHAAASVGMSRRGILYAAKRDPALAQQIQQARLEARLEPINKIARSRSWQAAAWLLERSGREWRLPPKASAARRTKKLAASKRLCRQIRRMVQELLD